MALTYSISQKVKLIPMRRAGLRAYYIHGVHNAHVNYAEKGGNPMLLTFLPTVAAVVWDKWRGQHDSCIVFSLLLALLLRETMGADT